MPGPSRHGSGGRPVQITEADQNAVSHSPVSALDLKHSWTQGIAPTSNQKINTGCVCTVFVCVLNDFGGNRVLQDVPKWRSGVAASLAAFA